MTDETMTIDKQSFKKMLDKNDADEARIIELEKERVKLYTVAIKTLEIIGMAENGKLKIKDGGLNIRNIISGAKPTISLLIHAQFSAKAEEKLRPFLAQFLNFLQVIYPIIHQKKGDLMSLFQGLVGYLANRAYVLAKSITG